ncbi:hypothetical protein Lal_00030017 [Lupinus albus]|uniref:RING-type E3 ubiquitin transferase n=1 Tax=Lupinus albus TaxID=3870 RepID=A0A6A4P9U6_LUPAL|nr:putative transcription factor C2H2 family [Lupinus albus]KAF1874589.1 hypothetical protein Lal_00030017 [Lupinus albus]
MSLVTEKTTTKEEHMKWRKPRNQIHITETYQNPEITSITQSITCKSTISSFFSNNNETTNRHHSRKKVNFSAASTFRGLGCTAGASQQVSVPAVILSSGDWVEKKKKKKGRKNKHKIRNSNVVVIPEGSSSSSNSPGFVDFQDVWCGRGIGFSTTDATVSVDCVVTKKNVSSRGKIDVEKITHRESSSQLGRSSGTPGTISLMDTDPEIFAASDSESFGPVTPYYRHIRDPLSDDSSHGFAEVLRLNSHDQFRDWRLDIDNMTYEQLLDLGERIGYVNTGLKEDEMGCNIRKSKFQFSDDALKHEVDKKCSICQEEFEADDELGKLNCKHSYHFQCIKQWIVQKNLCPVCKQQVVARHSV